MNAAIPLLELAQQYLTDQAKVRASLECPVLVWETNSPESSGDPEADTYRTVAVMRSPVPRTGAPIVLRVQKDETKRSSLVRGVTVGRGPANDVVLPLKTVSGFHAYFQRDRAGGWELVDAHSRNGTRLGTKLLAPEKPHALADTAPISFGEVRVLFMLPERFFAYLEQQLRSTGGGEQSPS